MSKLDERRRWLEFLVKMMHKCMDMLDSFSERQDRRSSNRGRPADSRGPRPGLWSQARRSRRTLGLGRGTSWYHAGCTPHSRYYARLRAFPLVYVMPWSDI